MDRHFLQHSHGQERFAFLYIAISALAIAVVMSYSAVTGLSRGVTAVVLAGALIGAWATIFTFLELWRLTRTRKDRAGEALPEEPDPYAPRNVVVTPSTGDPCPHHEYYPESAGFDQGQLTSRIQDETPLIEQFLNRRHKEKPAAVRS